MRSKIMMVQIIISFAYWVGWLGKKYSLSVCSECAGCMVEGYFKLLPLASKWKSLLLSLNNYEDKRKAGWTVKRYIIAFLESAYRIPVFWWVLNCSATLKSFRLCLKFISSGSNRLVRVICPEGKLGRKKAVKSCDIIQITSSKTKLSRAPF